jgi:hypothetical protein
MAQTPASNNQMAIQRDDGNGLTLQVLLDQWRLASCKIGTVDLCLPGKHTHILAERFFLDGTAQMPGNAFVRQLERHGRARNALIDCDDMKAVARLDQFVEQAGRP